MSYVEQELKKVIEHMKAPNIAILGRSGAGKSTLINKVFGIDTAKAGAGSPVTKEFKRYCNSLDNQPPIVLYDSPGYEVAQGEIFFQKTIGFLNHQKSQGVEEQIHLVWYVVNCGGKRFEQFDAEIINLINEQEIPIILVLTQCDTARPEEVSQLKEAIKKYNFKKSYALLEVAASPLEINGKPICEPFGLEKLTDKTVELIPTIYSDAVIAAQKVNIKDKRKVAWKYVAAAATATFTGAYIPIPGSSVGVMSTSQLALVKAIAGLYNSEELYNIFVTISGVTLAAGLTVTAAIVMDVLGTVFPPGFLVAESVAGAVGATYLVVSGLATVSVFEKLAENRISGLETKDEIKKFLQNTFKQEFDKYQHIKVPSPNALAEIGEAFITRQI